MGLYFTKSNSTELDIQIDLIRWWWHQQEISWKGTSANIDVTLGDMIVKRLTGSFLWEIETVTLGVYGSISAFTYSATVGPEISFDKQDNISLQIYASWDNTTAVIPTASLAAGISVSDMPSVYHREKKYSGSSQGVSISVPVEKYAVGVGMNYSNLYDEETGEKFSVWGATAFIGVSLPGDYPGLDSPYEGSENIWSTTTTVFTYNKGEKKFSIGSGGSWLAEALNTGREIKKYNAQYGY